MITYSFGDEIIKLARDKDEDGFIKRKAKGTVRGAAIGAGTAIGLPAALALLLARKGRGGLRARQALATMTGRKVPGLKHQMDREMLQMVGPKVTRAAGMTGAGLGALVS